MPVTLVDRLPLPNLKVYTAGSVLLLSIAVYYAVSVTSDPSWRVNATLQREDVVGQRDDDETVKMVLQPIVAPDAINGTRNITEQFIEVMTFMMQEPLCMWTVINVAYCSLALFGFLVQQIVFGALRVSEAQRVKDKLWNYVFYKFIFVFGVINVQYMDEVVLWCSWFTLLGCLHLLSQLCKDRFEYLSSSPNSARWAHVRLVCLLGGILASTVALLGVAAAWGLPAGKDTFAFMAAECVLVLVSALHVLARYGLQLHETDAAAPLAYYTHLLFDGLCLVVELGNVVHMVAYSSMVVSMPSLVLLMQMRQLLHRLQARLRRHRLYTTLAHHITRNYPMASSEEVQKNEDNCAICWEPMKEARKLPCAHLFHNSCLCQWVQQHASCPTCRLALAAHPQHQQHPQPEGAPQPLGRPRLLRLEGAADPRRANHLFHFDGSRYVSWLPSFSVEVTRVRAEPPAAPLAAPAGDAPAAPAPPEAMARQVRQVQAVFPQYSADELAPDLVRTRSPHLTIENILEGRLPRREPRAPQPSPLSQPQQPKPSPQAEPPRAGGEGEGSSFAAEARDREAALAWRREALLRQARARYLRHHAHDASPSPPLL